MRSARFVCVCVCVCLSRLEKRSSWCDQVQVWVSEKCRASNESKINREREPHSVAWRLRQARLCLLSCGVEREVRGTMEAQMTKEGGGKKELCIPDTANKGEKGTSVHACEKPKPKLNHTHTHTHAQVVGHCPVLCVCVNVWLVAWFADWLSLVLLAGWFAFRVAVERLRCCDECGVCVIQSMPLAHPTQKAK